VRTILEEEFYVREAQDKIIVSQGKTVLGQKAKLRVLLN